MKVLVVAKVTKEVLDSDESIMVGVQSQESLAHSLVFVGEFDTEDTLDFEHSVFDYLRL